MVLFPHSRGFGILAVRQSSSLQAIRTEIVLLVSLRASSIDLLICVRLIFPQMLACRRLEQVSSCGGEHEPSRGRGRGGCCSHAALDDNFWAAAGRAALLHANSRGRAIARMECGLEAIPARTLPNHGISRSCCLSRSCCQQHSLSLQCSSWLRHVDGVDRSLPVSAFRDARQT